jgi:hypothetical protein
MECKNRNIKRCVVAEFSMRAAADGHAALDSRLPSDGPTSLLKLNCNMHG